MCQPEPIILTPEPSVPVTPAPESIKPVIPKSTKIKNLPTQAEEQKKRKLVNDQQLLEQFRAKLHLNSIQFESALNPEPEAALKTKPEPEPKPESEPDPRSESALNHASEDVKTTTSTSLLFLPAKIKNTEVHFLIDSGAVNNFLSQNLVRRLDLPTNQLKPPVRISFADDRSQSIQRYCVVRVSFDPQYQPLLRFYVADIAHDAYLGQPWLASRNISIDWSSGDVHLTSNLVIQGIRKKTNQLSLMTMTCQSKKESKNNKYKPQILDPGWKSSKKWECHRDGHLYSHFLIPRSRYSLALKKISGHVT
ncbi:hypothetical protein MVEG_09004 [Podila verticillata NRRL 6337]|nr:hypothetical protein MVEG_09004 [Podila verticillata NRRL 6337]